MDVYINYLTVISLFASKRANIIICGHVIQILTFKVKIITVIGLQKCNFAI